MSTEIVAQTAFLIIARVGLFQFCRTYLLRSLVQDLRHLSSRSVPSSSSSSSPSFTATSTAASTSVKPVSERHSRSSPSPHAASSDNDDDYDDGGDGGGNESGELLPSPATSPSPSKPLSSPSFFRIPSQKPSHRSTDSENDNNKFHSRVSRGAFALCFSESCTLFLLVIFQTVDFLSYRTRLLNWNLSLCILVALILLVIPLLQCLFLAYPSSSAKLLQKRRLVALIPFSIYVYLLSRIPVPDSTSASSGSLRGGGATPYSYSYSAAAYDNVFSPLPALSRLTVMGVMILGVLAGFGAVRNACALFEGGVFWRGPVRQAVKQDSVDHANRSLMRVRGDLEARRAQLVAGAVSSLSPVGREGGSWVSRVFSGGDAHASLRQEITGLEALEREMSRNLERMKAQQARAAYDRTVGGRIWAGVGVGIGVYCVYQIFVSVLNVLLPSVRLSSGGGPNSKDGEGPSSLTPSDVIIRWVLATFPSMVTSLNLTPERAVSLSRQFSLVMVGLIVLGSVRLVLRGVNQALRVTSKNLGASLMLLILAQLMGTYLLSTLIQLRSSFPPPVYMSTPGETLFSSLPEFEVFGRLFDVCFLVSAAVSGAVQWVSGRVHGTGYGGDGVDDGGWEMVGGSI